MTGFFSLEEAAKRLGVDYKTIYRLVRSGELPAGKVGRVYRIQESDLIAYFEFQKRSLADQTIGARLFPLEGRQCASCNGRMVSVLSLGGQCQVCGADLCQACWAIRKVRHCGEHRSNDKTAVERTANDKSSNTAGDVSRVPLNTRNQTIESQVEELRRQGKPCVTVEGAKTYCEGYIRAFAQRLEAIEQLVDPLSKLPIILKNARVRHELAKIPNGPGAIPANAFSRFILRVGGWGKPKAELVLEARFLCRPSVFKEHGFDAEPLGNTQLAETLKELRSNAKDGKRFIVAQLASPTGWSGEAIATVINEHTATAFRDRRVAVGLIDLYADVPMLDEEDQRLRPFWPLLSPAKYSRELARCVDEVRFLVARYEHVPLDQAALECKADETWARAAFEALKRGGGYEFRDGTKGKPILSRC